MVESISIKPKKILDLGCGSGFVYKNIFWEVEKFVGYDLSKKMLNYHDKGKNIELRCENFDLISESELKKYDFLISSSSLQCQKIL